VARFLPGRRATTNSTSFSRSWTPTIHRRHRRRPHDQDRDHRAIEALRRTLACELGPHGIRVITLQTGGVPEAIADNVPEKTRQSITKGIEDLTMLGRAASLADVGNAAVFAASDMARALTATKLNITCGSIAD
jgi:hypothetical protein